MNRPLIAIDGPAGAGKSSTAQAVADRLGLPYLDTGALYRAAAWAVIKKNIDPGNKAAVIRLIEKAEIVFCEGDTGTRVWVDGVEATDGLRSPEVTKAVTTVCEIPEVRERLIDMHRKWAERGFGVMEGRDIGTVVLPNAGLKIFMNARPKIRALRRGRDLGIADNPEALAKLAAMLAERDRRDIERENSPLRKADDAVTIDTSDLMFDEQVNWIVRLASERFAIKLYTANRTG